MNDISNTTAADQQERIALVQSSAREFLSHEWSTVQLRALIDSGGGYDSALWVKMCELGWPGLMLSESEGGSDGNFFELAAIAEECGRALAPTPLMSHVIGGEIARRVNSPSLRAELLEAIARGEEPLTVATLEAELVGDRRNVKLKATPAAAGWILNGEKRFVAAAREASTLVVAAQLEDGSPGLFAVPRTAAGLRIERLKPLDWSAIDAVTFEDVTVEEDRLIARGQDAADLLDDAILRSDVLVSAEMCGLAQTALGLAADYARVRETYGKPIGQYQAVKHRLVNMLADIEIAKALLRAASNEIAAGSPTRRVAAAEVAYWSIDVLKKVPESCIQVFGGIGFTWEHDIHLYLRRCATLASFLGERAEHREAIVNALDRGTGRAAAAADGDG
jgi:alkylation response protein AidB-like acyl-CoA dehydrogenase